MPCKCLYVQGHNKYTTKVCLSIDQNTNFIERAHLDVRWTWSSVIVYHIQYSFMKYKSIECNWTENMSHTGCTRCLVQLQVNGNYAIASYWKTTTTFGNTNRNLHKRSTCAFATGCFSYVWSHICHAAFIVVSFRFSQLLFVCAQLHVACNAFVMISYATEATSPVPCLCNVWRKICSSRCICLWIILIMPLIAACVVVL